MNIQEALRSINSYPIPVSTLEEIAISHDLNLTDTLTKEVMDTADYRLAKADVLTWLASAPDVSQGGQNYGFSEDQRLSFRSRAHTLREECGDCGSDSVYGYKGSRL